MSFRNCPGCLKELSSTSFYYAENRRDKCSVYCIECTKDRASEPSVKAAKAEYHKQYRLRPENKLRRLEQSAATRGLEFDLTEDQIPPLPTHCPILGFKFYAVPGDKDYSPSIDRIDNSKGYIKGNIHWVSGRANWLKRDMTMREMRLIGEFCLSVTGHTDDIQNISHMKVCTSCHKLLPLAEYHKRHDMKDGHRSHCKNCVRDRASARKNPAKPPTPLVNT